MYFGLTHSQEVGRGLSGSWLDRYFLQANNCSWCVPEEYTHSISVSALRCSGSQRIWSLSRERWSWNGNTPWMGWCSITRNMFTSDCNSSSRWNVIYSTTLQPHTRILFLWKLHVPGLRWLQWGGCWEFPILSKRLRVFWRSLTKQSQHWIKKRQVTQKVEKNYLCNTWNAKHCQTWKYTSISSLRMHRSKGRERSKVTLNTLA